MLQDLVVTYWETGNSGEKFQLVSLWLRCGLDVAELGSSGCGDHARPKISDSALQLTDSKIDVLNIQKCMHVRKRIVKKLTSREIG